jgi:hypothetical protein
MSTQIITTPVEQIDVLLRQAEQFYSLDLVGEAIARLRYVLSRCDEEIRSTHDEHLKLEISARRTYAMQMLERLGALHSSGN